MRIALTPLTVLVAAAVSLLPGCGKPEPADLTGTAWQLTDIESMAPDEQPSTTIDDPARYTVTFEPEGRAAFQVDCNRGNASWQAAASGPDSGTLSFGPIALTRMACPQPSADAAVTAALGRVRGYLISEGKLHLSLEADSGIMHWRPVP